MLNYLSSARASLTLLESRITDSATSAWTIWSTKDILLRFVVAEQFCDHSPPVFMVDRCGEKTS